MEKKVDQTRTEVDYSIINFNIIIVLIIALMFFQNFAIDDNSSTYMIISSLVILLIALLLIRSSAAEFTSQITKNFLLISITAGVVISLLFMVFVQLTNIIIATIITSLAILIFYFCYSFILGSEMNDLMIEECYNGQGADISIEKNNITKKSSILIPSLLITTLIYANVVAAFYLNGSFS